MKNATLIAETMNVAHQFSFAINLIFFLYTNIKIFFLKAIEISICSFYISPVSMQINKKTEAKVCKQNFWIETKAAAAVSLGRSSRWLYCIKGSRGRMENFIYAINRKSYDVVVNSLMGNWNLYKFSRQLTSGKPNSSVSDDAWDNHFFGNDRIWSLHPAMRKRRKIVKENVNRQPNFIN